MNLGRIVCAIRGHDWSRWKTVPANRPAIEQLCVGGTSRYDANKPFRKRRCKRCGKTETAPLLAPVRKRAANAADTIQKDTP